VTLVTFLRRAGVALVALMLFVTACGGNPEPGVRAESGVFSYCTGARDYLTERLGNPALVEPDSIQDWRTRQTFPGCRVYAAGATSVDMNLTAERFYEALLSSGWVRTPDARDMPNEAAIRLRREEMDCLYHVYNGPLLNTPLELEVSGAVRLNPGDRSYNILAQCMPAMPAAAN
jgi:hypothetical protein